MTNLADAILFTIGYGHWLRMNELRWTRIGAPVTPEAFIWDLSWRQGRFGYINRRELIAYLTERLTPGRLALPWGYEIDSQKPRK